MATTFDSITGAKLDNSHGLRRSFRSSSSKANSYTFKVEVEGFAVYCNPIQRGAIQALAATDKAFMAEMKEIQRAAQAEEIDADTAEQRSFAAIDSRESAYKSALLAGHEGEGSKVIAAWDFPDDEPGSKLPCNADTIRDLPLDVVVQLITLIQQKQTLGQTDADFLARKR